MEEDKCKMLKVLKNKENSCYLDSVIIALFAVPNIYIDTNILNKELSLRKVNLECSPVLKNGEEDLKNRTEIQSELQKIVLYMRGESTEPREYCTELRQLIYKKCTRLDVEKGMRRIPINRRQMDATEFLVSFLNLFDVNALLVKVDVYYDNKLSLESMVMNSVLLDPPSFVKDVYYTQEFIVTEIPTDMVIEGKAVKRLEVRTIVDTPLLIIRVDRNTYVTDPITNKPIPKRDTTSVICSEYIETGSKKKLKLRAIICNKVGHYICYILCNGMWYLYNDLAADNKRIENVGTYNEMMSRTEYSPTKDGVLYFYEEVEDVSNRKSIDYSIPEIQGNTSLYIYPPNSFPFGALSNNYKQDEFFIDGEKYNAVTNYIYSNMLTSPIKRFTNQSYITSLKLYGSSSTARNIGDVVPLYYDYQAEVNNQIQKDSFETANEIKFNNALLSQKLLSTGNRPIFFISDNSVFGVSSGLSIDGRSRTFIGENYVGKSLERLRTKIRVSMEGSLELSRDDSIYKAYKAYKLLEKQIKNRNNDLSMFLTEDVDAILKNVPGSIDETKADVLKKYSSGMDSDLIALLDSDPTVLVNKLRKDYLRKLIEQRNTQPALNIFMIYLNYILKTKYPSLDQKQYPLAIAQQLDKMTQMQTKQQISKIVKAYFSNTLPTEVQDYMVQNLAKTTDYKDAEVAERIEVKKSDVSKEPVIIANELPEYQSFSPSFPDLINVNSYFYPSVDMYILTQLIYSVNIKPTYENIAKWNLKYSYDDAYKNILRSPLDKITSDTKITPDTFKNIKEVQDILSLQETNITNERLQSFARKALDTKFSNRNMQDLLYSTNKRNLVWNDKNDSFLGVKKVGEIPGLNYVGKYLTTIRQYIGSNGVGVLTGGIVEVPNIPIYGPIIVTEENMMVLLEDDFIRSWMKMRMEDLIYVTLEVKRSMRGSVIDVEHDRVFINRVLSSMYPPCYSMNKRVVTSYPNEYFYTLLKGNPAFSNIDTITLDEEGNTIVEDTPTNVLLEFWRYIMNILLFVVVDMNKNTVRDVENTIIQSEIFLSQKRGSDFNDCINSALINVLSALQKLQPDSSLTEEDIFTAKNIILGSKHNNKAKALGEEEDTRRDMPLETEFVASDIEEGSFDVEMPYSDSDSIGSNVLKEDDTVVEYYNPDDEIKEWSMSGNDFSDSEEEDDQGSIRDEDVRTTLVSMDKNIDISRFLEKFSDARATIRDYRLGSAVFNRVNFFSDCV